MKRYLEIPTFVLGVLLGGLAWLDGDSPLPMWLIRAAGFSAYQLFALIALVLLLAGLARRKDKIGKWGRNDFWLFFGQLIKRLRQSISVFSGLVCLAGVAYLTTRSASALTVATVGALFIVVLSWYQFCICNLATAPWLRRN